MNNYKKLQFKRNQYCILHFTLMRTSEASDNGALYLRENCTVVLTGSLTKPQKIKTRVSNFSHSPRQRTLPVCGSCPPLVLSLSVCHFIVVKKKHLK